VSVEPRGIKALREARQTAEQMWRGLDPAALGSR
jgi:hypothetical protein